MMPENAAGDMHKQSLESETLLKNASGDSVKGWT
jgi:hypothetical protein